MTWTTPPLPCTLNGIAIHVDEITDLDGASLALHQYPGVDGADIEHLGGDASQIAIVGSVAGSGWLEDLEVLRAVVASRSPATLVHPQRGTLTGYVRQLRVAARESEHDLARVQIEFVVRREAPVAFTEVTTPTSAAAAVRTSASAATAALAGMVD